MEAYLDGLLPHFLPYQNVALVIFIALVVLDGWTTWKVIRRDAGQEGNPILKSLMKELGTRKALVLSRLVAIGLAIYEPLICVPLIPVWAVVVYLNYRRMNAKV